MKQRIHTQLAVFLLVCASLAGCRTSSDDSDQQFFQLMLILYYRDFISNPCNLVAPPLAQSALPSGTFVDAASVTGRIVRSDGTPVIGALVIADGGPTTGDSMGNPANPVAEDIEHYSTHSSINSDGTFTLAGLPTSTVGVTYRIAVEPVHETFSGRIDTQLDCYRSPATFTPGWYAGDGASVIGDAASATTFTFTNADDNTVKDLGVIKLTE